MTPSDEVNAAEIARLADVTRAAVSNWRTRYRDFPRPVAGTQSSPRYSWAEVEEWMRATGKLQTDASAVALRDLVTGHAASGRVAGLAETVASLIPPLRRGLVLDPACGPGLLLSAAARRLGPAVRYAGQDASRSNVTVAATALADAGAVDVEIVVGSPRGADALGHLRGTADAVVCLPSPTRYAQPDQLSLDLPLELGSPSSGSVDPYLGWMQICYSYLKPDGVAIVPAPYATSVRGSGRRVRAELLRAGALRQVIALPEGFPAPMTGAWHLWVLHRPAGKPAYMVRFVDLTAIEPEDVPSDPKQWREIYGNESSTREVAAIELLDEDVPLVPVWHVEPPPRDVSREYARQRAELTKAAGRLDVTLPTFRRTSDPQAFPMTTIADLIGAGALELLDKVARPEPSDVIVQSGPGRYEVVVVPATAPGPTANPDRWTKPERSTIDVLRCNPKLLDPYFLACFLRSEANRRLAIGTTAGVSRSYLRRARIPRLPLTEQLPLAGAFRRLTRVTDQIETMAAMGGDAIQTAVDGLTSGMFVAESAD